MYEWLEKQGSWLAAAIFIALATSTTIGFKDGSKGGAIFVSNAASAIMAIVLYPLAEKWGYGGAFAFGLGLFCGGCGMALLGVLISLGNLIERRRVKLADAIMNRVAPETRDMP